MTVGLALLICIWRQVDFRFTVTQVHTNQHVASTYFGGMRIAFARGGVLVQRELEARALGNSQIQENGVAW